MARNFTIDPDNTKPNFPGMMLATIIALKDLGGSGIIDEITEQIIDNEGITEEAQSFLHPNDRRSKLNYYLAWARTYLNYHNAIENSTRGVWALTTIGIQTETLKQTTEYYKAYKEDKAQRDRSQRQRRRAPASGDENPPVDGDDNPPVADELPDETNSPDNDAWKTTLLDTLKSMEGYAFERLCQLLLREAGFIEVNVNPKKGADGGIDGVGVLRVNLVSFKVYFQCKCWTDSPVGSKDIRNFRGALYAGVDKGLFITTSNFTSSAKDEATVKGKIVIDLIDGERLCDLLKENNLGVQTEMVEQVNITPEWFDRFNIEPPKNQKPKPQKTKKRKK